jgi:PAS domain S-box-containing protein
MTRPSPVETRTTAPTEARGKRCGSREPSSQALAQFKYALDQAAIVVITDQRGVITYVNDKFCEISKYARNELIGQDHRIVNSRHHPPDFMRDLWRTIAQGQVWRGEIRNRAKDGSVYWVDTTIVPLLDARGKPCQYLAIRSDITRRKSAEARLLEQASLAKLGELAAMVAHEVRNPLAALKGALQVLGPRLPDDRPEHHIVKAMLNRIDALNERVNDILLYAGTTPPQIECVALEALLVDAAISARAATGSRHRIEIDASDLTVSADRHMLHEAIVNLLVNACQATNGPKPILATTQAAGGWCRIAVADRGPGIPPAIRERVFEPFYTTKPSGTGLGLAIVKRLMERQGGSVTLEDREGGGTVATIAVPLHVA